MRRLFLIAALALTACQPRAADSVEPEALDLVADAVAEELNGPPTAIQTLVRQSGEKAQVGWDVLSIGFDGKSYSAGGWLYSHGYLDLAGAQYVTRPVFALSKKALALLDAPDAPWFEAEAGETTRVDCKSEAALNAQGCEIELPVTPVLTPAGRDALGSPKLGPMTVRAVVAFTADGWQVVSFNTVGQTPQDVSLDLILGPLDGRDARALASLRQLQGQLGLGGENPEAAAAREPYQPPNYVVPDPPEMPVE